MEGTITNTGILRQLEEDFAEEIKPAGNDLGSLEVPVTQKLPLSVNALLQRLVNRCTGDYMGTPAACDRDRSRKFARHCSKGMHRRHKAKHNLVILRPMA